MKKKKKYTIQVWYTEELDIMTIVQSDGKIWKYCGSFCKNQAVINFVLDMNTWYIGHVSPSYGDGSVSSRLIGEL